MKKTSITIVLLLCAFTSNSQQHYKSDMQAIQNAAGASTSKNKASIEFKEPNKVGGEVGYIIVRLSKTESSITYGLQYVKQTNDQDGPISWYHVVNSDIRPEIFNIVKVQKFNKPVLQRKYEYSFTLSKYNSNQVVIYEHTYMAILDKMSPQNIDTKQESDQSISLDIKDIKSTNTPEELYKKYGKENVIVSDFAGLDGDYRNGEEYIIFPNTNNEIAVSYRKRYIRLYKNNSMWQLPHGIKVGDNIAEVERLNSKTFKLYGFEWDYAGIVTDWNMGNFENVLNVTFEPIEEVNFHLYQKVIGDKEILSTDTTLRKLAPVVSEIFIKK